MGPVEPTLRASPGFRRVRIYKRNRREFVLSEVIAFSEEANVVNVHIHQFKRGGAVVDAAALGQFQQQWETYRKLVASDVLSHRALGRILHATLNDVFASPFTFLDIACGDAFMMKAALAGTKVRHYH